MKTSCRRPTSTAFQEQRHPPTPAVRDLRVLERTATVKGGGASILYLHCATGTHIKTAG